MSRHDNMAAIKSTDTGPELKLRKELFSLGFRYRLYCRDLPGKPDLVFRSRRAVIFVNGCFWHHHEGCARAYTPKSHQDFWIPKIKRNVERDHEHAAALLTMGWRVLVVWECALKTRTYQDAAAAAAQWLDSSDPYAEVTLERGTPVLRLLKLPEKEDAAQHYGG